MNNMSIIHIPLPQLFDKLSSHHTQTKNIHLNVTRVGIQNICMISETQTDVLYIITRCYYEVSVVQ